MSNNASSITLTEEKDIIYSGFKLHKNGLQAIGNPTFEQWQECGEFIKKSNGAVHFWIGDWLNYGEQKWGEMYTQVLDETGFDYGILIPITKELHKNYSQSKKLLIITLY